MDLVTLLVIAQPPADVLLAIETALSTEGLEQRLAGKIFPSHLWHQSLSHKLDCTRDQRDRIAKSCSQIDAPAFTMPLNSVGGEARTFGSIHWALRPKGRPPGFDAALTAIRKALRTEDMGKNSPLVTISYGAHVPLASTPIRPIPWRIDEVQLVEIHNDSQRYHPIARWPLRAAPPGMESQLNLW